MAGGAESYKFLRNGVEELTEYDKQCCLFLERMRHSSSYEMVQKFKGFVNNFVGTQHTTAEECSEAVHTFIEDIFVSLSEHPLWREENHTSWDWATEAAERYLMTKLFKVTYVLPCTTDINDDEKFYHRARTLQFLEPSHFDIPNRPLNQTAMELAAQELYKADSECMKSPKEKLTCILNCITILSNLLKHYSDEQGTGADDMLPYLIYTILLLSPKKMQSNIRYISRFRRQSKMESEAAYYFTQVESAVLFISDANHTNLSISEQQFREGVERCEAAIKSGLDVHQFVASSDSALPSRRPFPIPVSVAKPSPILARKANVIEEWTTLQRTRALSKSEADKKPAAPSPVATSSEVTPPSGISPTVTPPRGAPPAALGGDGLVGSTANFNRNGTGTAGMGTDEAQKFLTARFEELTVSDLKQLHNSYKVLVGTQLTV